MPDFDHQSPGHFAWDRKQKLWSTFSGTLKITRAFSSATQTFLFAGTRVSWRTSWTSWTSGSSSGLLSGTLQIQSKQLLKISRKFRRFVRVKTKEEISKLNSSYLLKSADLSVSNRSCRVLLNANLFNLPVVLWRVRFGLIRLDVSVKYAGGSRASEYFWLIKRNVGFVLLYSEIKHVFIIELSKLTKKFVKMQRFRTI